MSNRDGRIIHDGRQVLNRMVDQVANPVRWDLCQETMAELGVSGLLEVPPAGTLTGLAKRALPGVETFALKTPDQLDDARAFVDKHAQSNPLDASPTWRLVISPIKGTFTRGDATVGDNLKADSVVGTVTSLRDSADVLAPHGGTVIEWLVEDGDPVGPGQPLIRLHPEVSGA